MCDCESEFVYYHERVFECVKCAEVQLGVCVNASVQICACFAVLSVRVKVCVCVRVYFSVPECMSECECVMQMCVSWNMFMSVNLCKCDYL